MSAHRFQCCQLIAVWVALVTGRKEIYIFLTVIFAAKIEQYDVGCEHSYVQKCSSLSWSGDAL
jgi:hypothetical protein